LGENPWVETGGEDFDDDLVLAAGDRVGELEIAGRSVEYGDNGGFHVMISKVLVSVRLGCTTAMKLLV
jgi:hypothetical protein